MGCTSSKKRTTSIDDLTGQKKDSSAPGDAASKKNGQVTANDKPIMRETAKQTGSEAPDSGTKAIQIPGAHKSFLAPDGIPFIDEDVDDELESGGTTRVVTAKADVNKNVVPASPPRPVAAAVTPAAPTVVKPPTAAQIQQQEEEERKRAVAADILRQELAITSPAVQVQPTTVTVTHSEHHEPTVEEQQKAAVKIQAGIRGYRDRQKVKAIRAAKEHPSNGPDTSHAEHAEHHEHTPEEDAAIKIQASYKGFKARQQVKTMKEHGEHGHGDGDGATSTIVYNEHHTEDHLVVEHPADQHPPPSPEMERAATKIQASYKGYKTRKELGRLHHTEDN